MAPADGKSVNSGERMTFIDCTFAASARAIDIQSDSMDLVFDACSFDFNGGVVHFGQQARFGTVAFNHCHIEGIDGLLVNATTAGPHLRTVFRDSIVLPRHWKREELRSVPRRLVAGNAKFSASGVEWRFELPEQRALTALIGDEVPVESITAMSFQRIQALPWRGSVINADSLFALDSLGTPAGALTYWRVSCVPPTKTLGTIVTSHEPLKGYAMDKPRQALRLTLPAQDNTLCTVTTKASFTVSPGEAVMAACSVITTGVRGRTRFAFQFYTGGDAPGVPLRTYP